MRLEIEVGYGARHEMACSIKQAEPAHLRERSRERDRERLPLSFAGERSRERERDWLFFGLLPLRALTLT